jgi:NAD(P)-dependent dehydrogenase (short-subunit alcohol dehydrogenase family)
MAMQGEGHIVNTASIAGVFPGFSPAYDASKHAVVAITEDLYNVTKSMGMPIGVSVLCPGWVRTGILDAERNWPSERGAKPEASIGAEFVEPHLRRAIDEGATPAAVADLVADAVVADRFWVFPQRDFLELAIARWHSIAEGQNPDPNVKVPGLPSPEELMAQVAALMAGDQ